MRECPIKFSCFGVQRTEGERTVADAGDRNDLRIVSGRKNFVRLLEFLVGEGLLDHGYTTVTQEADSSLASDARQERSVWHRSKHNSIFSHKDVCRGEFGNIA